MTAVEVHAYVKAQVKNYGTSEGRRIIMTRICRENEFAAAAICFGLKIAEMAVQVKKEAEAAAKAAMPKTVKKTKQTTTKKGKRTMKTTARLSLLAAIALLFSLTMALPAVAKHPGPNPVNLIAMPMTGLAAKQVLGEMNQQEEVFNQVIAKTEAEEDEARLLFVVFTSEIMAKYRYSLDKTLAFVAARAGDDALIDFLRRVRFDGTIGTAFQLLQKKGWGEKAVDMGVVSAGTLSAVRSTSIGKE